MFVVPHMEDVRRFLAHGIATSLGTKHLDFSRRR